jgi:hypothetical protein
MVKLIDAFSQFFSPNTPNLHTYNSLLIDENVELFYADRHMVKLIGAMLQLVAKAPKIAEVEVSADRRRR